MKSIYDVVVARFDMLLGTEQPTRKAGPRRLGESDGPGIYRSMTEW